MCTLSKTARKRWERGDVTGDQKGNDTYLVIPACNIDSREREISNIEAWSRVNNLTLNQSKSAEIVFTDGRKRRLVQPQPLQRIARHAAESARCTVTEKLSVAEHVDDVMCTVHVCYQRPAFTRHVRTTTAAGLSVSRHLKAHLRYSSVVGFFDVC